MTNLIDSLYPMIMPGVRARANDLPLVTAVMERFGLQDRIAEARRSPCIRNDSFVVLSVMRQDNEHSCRRDIRHASKMNPEKEIEGLTLKTVDDGKSSTPEYIHSLDVSLHNISVVLSPA